MINQYIHVKGAKEHNLKDLDIKIPRNKFVVITGLSGSGKSSLAFDTIYAEGQRRYVESLSAYARQFLGQMKKPDVEFIDGLSPAISIDQKTTSRNPRSTVGTVTEIYDYLRLLYANIGIPYCPKCGKKITSQNIDQIVDQILTYEDRTKILVIAPIIRGRKGEYKKELELIRKEGFVRVKIDGVIYDVTTDDINLEKQKKHTIGIVIDRLIIKKGINKRLTDSVEMALERGKGLVIIEKDSKEEILFSKNLSCEACGVNITDIAPRMFSFNTPYGACDHCKGLGRLLEIDENLIVPDKSLSLNQGAIKVSGFNVQKNSTYYISMLQSLSGKYHINLDAPYEKLDEEAKKVILFGIGKEKIDVDYQSKDSDRTYTYSSTYSGVINTVQRRYKETNSNHMRRYYESFMTPNPCPSCHGKRLKPEVLAIKINNKNIHDVTCMSIKDCQLFFENINLNEKETIIANQIIKEISERLNFLINVGLNYLTLSRQAATLSGGEAQRIRLATQIGSGLVGVLYILDEPSIGLHQRDNAKLLDTLIKMKNLGNTLLVVEHDVETIERADHIIDMGPGAGVHGGEVVVQGNLKKVLETKKSITGQYLTGKKQIPIPESRRKPNGKYLKIVGAKQNNLKEIDVAIPLGLMTCVTGVSGSGKSSLINEILYKELASTLNRAHVKSGKHKHIEGIEYLDKVIDIDQSPIGRTPRSNPATYTGVFDAIRDMFAMTQEARARGYKKGRFSFNVPGGRCEACKGDGIIKIAMHFLPDVYVPCEVCKSKRYSRETLEVKYKGKNISDVLNMTVEDALEFFKNIPKIKRKMQLLYDVGLGYIKVGQPSTTLSGGEAQRIKLATELSKRSTGRTLYILDEPTTGLHMADVHKLMKILQKLVEGGNTVIIIEHNLDVIKCADYIIDLGPEGGDDGGQLLIAGTPEEVAKFDLSYTGQFLQKLF
ncbi:MAG: excinuclease ABC subunit UvrA [Clostridiales bacterium]|nr:excinuclease ABC subunit UvrA [Clostridiales bacterium]